MGVAHLSTQCIPVSIILVIFLSYYYIFVVIFDEAILNAGKCYLSCTSTDNEMQPGRKWKTSVDVDDEEAHHPKGDVFPINYQPWRRFGKPWMKQTSPSTFLSTWNVFFRDTDDSLFTVFDYIRFILPQFWTRGIHFPLYVEVKKYEPQRRSQGQMVLKAGCTW